MFLKNIFKNNNKAELAQICLKVYNLSLFAIYRLKSENFKKLNKIHLQKFCCPQNTNK